MSESVLSPAEEAMMKMATQAAMRRAADIIDNITQFDVAVAQMALFREGVPIADVHKVDRALIASCHLRACAELCGDADQHVRSLSVFKTIMGRVQS